MEFIHAHICVASTLVRHTPRHTVTEQYRRSCSPPGRRRVEAPIRLCSDDGQRGSYQLVRRVSTDKQAIAVFLDRIPFRADPTFAAMLDIGTMGLLVRVRIEPPSPKQKNKRRDNRSPCHLSYALRRGTKLVCDVECTQKVRTSHAGFPRLLSL